MEPVLRFTLANKPYSVPLALVAELVEVPAYGTVPGAPSAIAGVADIRGKVVTLVDLAKLLELPVDEPAARHIAVVLSGAYSHLALLVRSEVEVLLSGFGAPSSSEPLEQAESDTPAHGAGAQEMKAPREAAVPPIESAEGETAPGFVDGGAVAGSALDETESAGNECTTVDVAEMLAQCCRQVRDRRRGLSRSFFDLG